MCIFKCIYILVFYKLGGGIKKYELAGEWSGDGRSGGGRVVVGEGEGWRAGLSLFDFTDWILLMLNIFELW